MNCRHKINRKTRKILLDLLYHFMQHKQRRLLASYMNAWSKGPTSVAQSLGPMGRYDVASFITFTPVLRACPIIVVNRAWKFGLRLNYFLRKIHNATHTFIPSVAGSGKRIATFQALYPIPRPHLSHMRAYPSSQLAHKVRLNIPLVCLPATRNSRIVLTRSSSHHSITWSNIQ